MQAAQQGRPEAQYKVGYLYEQGLGTTKDTAQAIVWYEKADKQGFPDAHDALKAIEEK
jgi:TPR repeat protein